MYSKIKDLPDFEDIKYIFFRKKVEDFIYRFEHLNKKYKSAFAKKLKKDSSLIKEELFPPSMVRGRFTYNYLLFKSLAEGGAYNYTLQKVKVTAMYKVLEVLYKEPSVFYLKYRKIVLKIKKRPEILDIYLDNDRIYVRIFKKIKFDFIFKNSELRKFEEDY